jgi:folate-dependent phosphoribosylglycinamide formyltransferase PurN
MTKVAVLISGRGSNMEALVRAAQDSACPFEIALVLSNKPEAGGLVTAAAAGIEALASTRSPSARTARPTSAPSTPPCASAGSRSWPWPATCAS